MTNTTVGRFQVITASMMKMPSKCSTCGSFSSAHGKEYVDFGLWVEFYGNVYICTECFLGAAGELGVVPVVKYNEAITQINEYKAVVKTLIEENGILRNATDSLRAIDRPDPDSISYCDHGSLEQDTVEHEPVIGDESGSSDITGDTAADNTGSTDREEGSAEPNNVGGSEDVRNDDSSVTTLFGGLGLDI
jgi:hypothetical protein